MQNRYQRHEEGCIAVKKCGLSYLLAFALLFNLLSFSFVSAGPAPAEELTSTADNSVKLAEDESVELSSVPANIQNLVSDPTEDKIYLMSDPRDEAEIFTLRTENSETGEGTLTVHSVPVKYVDQAGEYQFIDTSMKALTSAERAESGYVYRNSANSFTLEFGNTASEGINFNNAFTFEANSNTAGSGIGQIQMEEGYGKIVYPHVFASGTKVEYINTESGLKENIILDQYTGQNRFDFTFRSDTHVPVLTENGANILVTDKDDPETVDYRFLSLYAYDSYDPTTEPERQNSDFRHMNEELYYELTDNGSGVYTITVVVPEEYLTHPEIVYPVTIDPSVMIVSSNSNAQDTFVSAATPTTQTNSALDYIRFGKVNGYKTFGYHRFTSLPSLPTGANITSAYIKFTFRTGQNTPTASSGIKFWTLQVTDYQWYESSITWNNQPYGSSGPYTSFTYNGSYLDYVNANITDMVKSWYSGSPNYGIDFTYSNEDYNDYNSVVSSEGEATRAPVLKIGYSYSAASGISTNTVYYIKAAHSGKYLDVDGSSDKSGNVTQFNYHGGTNQQWKVVYKGSGYYQLYSMNSYYKGKSLDIESLSTNNVNVYEGEEKDWLLWAIVPNGDGTYRLVNKWSETSSKVLSVSGSSTSNSANVIQSTWTGSSSQRWYFEKRSSKGKVNHSGNMYIGMSSDNYLNNTCSFGSRVSSQCADYFGQFLGGTGYNNVSFSVLFNRKNGNASKSDFLSKAYHANSNANIDDVHLMLFVGHGRADYGLHFTNGVYHGENHNASNINFPRSEATFGYGDAKTKWVVAYTCNFLTGTNDSVRSTLRGANAVLGYGSGSYLVRDQMGLFAQKIKSGGNIIDSWLESGKCHSEFAPKEIGAAILKAVYVVDARSDTLYNYLYEAGEYGVEVYGSFIRSYPPCDA